MARAMSDSAKAEKAQYILEKAYECFENCGYSQLKMKDIAKAAGVSNGTLFFYFNTKESLFIEILINEMNKRMDSLMAVLSTYESVEFDLFKALILDEMASVLIEDSVMMRLIAIMNSVLEQNIDYETAIRVKQDLYANIEKLGNMFAEKVGFLTVEEGINIMMAQHAMIVGFMNMTIVPDVIKQAVDDLGLESLKIDFKTHTVNAMSMYLDGLHEKYKL